MNNIQMLVASVLSALVVFAGGVTATVQEIFPTSGVDTTAAITAVEESESRTAPTYGYIDAAMEKTFAAEIAAEKEAAVAFETAAAAAALRAQLAAEDTDTVAEAEVEAEAEEAIAASTATPTTVDATDATQSDETVYSSISLYTSPQDYTSEIATYMLEKVNALRASVGVGALSYDYSLQATAQVRASEIYTSGYFSHTRPNGTSCFTAFPGYAKQGENLAYIANSGNMTIYDIVDRMFENLCASSGHYAAMVNENYNSFGVALYGDSSYFSLQQSFGYDGSAGTSYVIAGNGDTEDYVVTGDFTEEVIIIPETTAAPEAAAPETTQAEATPTAEPTTESSTQIVADEHGMLNGVYLSDIYSYFEEGAGINGKGLTTVVIKNSSQYSDTVISSFIANYPEKPSDTKQVCFSLQ